MRGSRLRKAAEVDVVVGWRRWLNRFGCILDDSGFVCCAGR